MLNIKIYGERNSGTTFLKKLLSKNLLNVNIEDGIFKNRMGWKHSFLYKKIVKKFKRDTLFIFLIRDLESWLKSMYKNPYHIERRRNIKEFISKPILPKERRPKHPINLDIRERSNIVSLRYGKILSYLGAMSHMENYLFLNLEDLQKNYEKVLAFISENFNIRKREKVIPILKHTKTKKNMQNRNYNLDLPYIKNRNKKIEDFVSSLKNKYLYKTNLKKKKNNYLNVK
jgi:hypothetical protein